MPSHPYPGSELDLFARASNWKAYWASCVRPYMGERVLEVGAGIGTSTLLLCDQRAQQWVCVEPDAMLADRLRRELGRSPLTQACDVRVGTIDDVDPSARFHCILYLDVLEHIDDDVGEMRRAAEHLLPNGHLLVLAPAHQWLWSEFDRAIGHRRRYSLAALLACAPPMLTVVRSLYLDSVGLLASLANHALLKQPMVTARQIRTWDTIMVPASRVADALFRYRLGKAVLMVWQRTS